MTDEYSFGLSRRKALAAIGSIGVASAGAGLGTSAYFSDQETFENNQLTAGSLDLGVGYSSHYSDWSDDEGDGVGSIEMYDGQGTGSVADLASGMTGLPANDAWLIAVPDGDVGTFLANTQQSSANNGGCDGPAAVTNAEDIESTVINLNDVKPGDFGEVTFDFQLCTNPGYVWMNNPGSVVADEGSVTEPEADDPQETEGVVELLDEAMAAIWLDTDVGTEDAVDDGNNYQNGGESPLLVDTLGNVLDALGSGNGVRIDGVNRSLTDIAPTDFTRTGVTRFDFSNDGSYDSDVELAANPDGSGKVAHATSGGTETADYVTTGVSLASEPTLGNLTDDPSNPTTTLTYDYYGGPNNDNSAPDEVYLLIEESDGTRHVVYRASNDGAPADEMWKTRNVHREVAGNPDNNPGYNWFEITDSGNTNLGGGGPTSDLSTEYGDDAVVLAMAAGRGTTGGGDVLDTYYTNPAVGGSSAGTFPTSCFRGNTEYSLAFAWWLPVDHANQVQTDSVEFDLGFYTEQCRHNDGSGMPPRDRFTSDEVYVHRTSDLGFSNDQTAISEINAASSESAPDLQPIVVEVTYGDPVTFEIHPTLGMENPSNMVLAFDPEADGGAWDSQVLWESGGTGFTYIENGGVSDSPSNVSGVSASYDSGSNTFTIEIERSRLAAGGDDYRFAMQSIHEPTAPNNPLNPSGSNARIDAELPNGFDFGDTSTFVEDTLR